MYQDIVFLNGYDIDGREALNIVRNIGEKAAIEFLSGYDYGDNSEIREEKPWGKADQTYECGEYILSYNIGLDYIALTKKVYSQHDLK